MFINCYIVGLYVEILLLYVRLVERKNTSMSTEPMLVCTHCYGFRTNTCGSSVTRRSLLQLGNLLFRLH